MPTIRYRRSVNPSRLYEKSAISLVSKWVGGEGQVLDTSAGSGPDFEIKYNNGASAIGEIGAHIDPNVAAAWSSVRKREKHQIIDLPDGSGVWVIHLDYGANIDRLYKKLPTFISKLLETGTNELDLLINWSSGPLDSLAEHLGIEQIYRKVSVEGDYALFFLQGSGGSVPSDGNLIVPWIESILNERGFNDIWQKLFNYEDKMVRKFDEKHVFLISGSLTDFGVGQLLMDIENNMPSNAPTLPDGITHMWVQSEVSASHAAVWSDNLGWALV